MEIRITGTILETPTFCNEFKGEKFFKTSISSLRKSGVADVLQLVIPEIYVGEIESGCRVSISGEIRTRNSDGHLFVYVFVHYVTKDAWKYDINETMFDGYICKIFGCRDTPGGKTIADFLLAVNRKNSNKSDYIPCIAWGRNAYRISELNVGNKISVSGRLQSRTYMKKINEENFEERIAYEVSVISFEEVSDSEKE